MLWFALGGAIHWICDALTISGAPVHWWSDRRATLFGGRVRTGSASEYLITGLIVLVCALVIWSRRDEHGAGFIPYFYNWPSLYEAGLVDGAEWRAKTLGTAVIRAALMLCAALAGCGGKVAPGLVDRPARLTTTDASTSP